MWMVQRVFDLLGPRGAAANAASVIDAHHSAMAEVDSVVARLHRHAAVRQPAA